MARSNKSSSSSRAKSSNKPIRVAFLHPNLGIGGAERLIVDCASALQQSGTATVHLFTNYHDPSHCYPETRDGTLKVTVYGQTTDNIFGKFRVLIAILRMIYLTIIFAVRHSKDFDVLVVDQVSHSIPFLKWFTSCKVLFYCHFPDQLLASRASLIKRIYRYPFDLAEEWTTGKSDRILVNSEFTLETFRNTFTRLAPLVDAGQVKVLYPSIDFARYSELTSEDMTKLPKEQKAEVQLLDDLLYRSSQRVYLLTSINRYERKKNIQLAIEAFAEFSARSSTGSTSAPSSSGSRKKKSSSSSSSSSTSASSSVRLLICGGYDPVNIENQEHYRELVAAAKKAGCKVVEFKNEKHGKNTLLEYEDEQQAREAETSGKPIVYFLRSFTDLQRSWLLSHSLAILYTPTNEHFGIVPVEAMYMRRPVIACRSGGPKESIVDWNKEKTRSESTGFLCEPNVQEWSQAMRNIVDLSVDTAATSSRSSRSDGGALGERGRCRVLERFHFDAFQAQLIEHIRATWEQ